MSKKAQPTVSRKDRYATITVEGKKLPPLGHGVAKRSGAGIHGGSKALRNKRNRLAARKEAKNTDH